MKTTVRPAPVLVVLILAALASAAAQDRRIVRPDGSAERRVALVVGNDQYAAAPLVNAANDARAVAAALGQVGFAVETIVNASAESMARAVEQFTGRVQPGDVALFYYSGHGVQVDGVNFLLPVDFRGGDEVALKFRATSVNEIDERLERRGARVRLLVLDACRDNPFRGTRSGAQGLASYTAEGALIAYATAAGRTASDNPGAANGLFTQYFLEGLRKPGISATDLFKWIRLQVREVSGGRQVPWLHDGLIGEFLFRASDASPAPSPAAPAGSVLPAADPAGVRLAFVNVATDRAAAAQPHAEQLRRDAAVAMLFNSGAVTVGWLRPDLDITPVIDARMAGRSVALPALAPVTTVAWLFAQDVVNASAVGRGLTAEFAKVSGQLTADINQRKQRVTALQQTLAGGSFRTEQDKKAIQDQIAAAERGLTLAQQSGEAKLTELNQRSQESFRKQMMTALGRYVAAARVDVVLDSEAGVLCAAPAAAAAPAIAQIVDGNAAPAPQVPRVSRVAYVNSTRLARETVLGKGLQAQFMTWYEAKQKEVAANPGLAAAAQQESTERSQAALKTFEQKVMPIIKAFCAAQRIDLLWESQTSGLLAGDPALDVTAHVVRAIDTVHVK